MSASGIATRETTRSRQMGTNKPVTTQRCGVDPKKWYPFHDIWVYPAQHITWVVQTRYNARRVLYQKDVFRSWTNHIPSTKWGSTRVPRYRNYPSRSPTILCWWNGTVLYNPRNPPQQQMCPFAQLTLQGHMLDHRQICVN